MTKYPFVYIVILNWNGWEDTIKCLESVFKLNFKDYKVVVCDNKSDDSSLSFIKDWADGSVSIKIAPNEDTSLAAIYQPPVTKPIIYKEISTKNLLDKQITNEIESPELVLIQTESNLGYAGGNNVGIRYALSNNDCEYIWLLNNDTIVDKMSLTRMIERYLDSDNPGICSSTLLYYNSPDIVQAFGGAKYYPCFGYTKHIGGKEKFGNNIDWRYVEKIMDYPVGASMLVCRSFLESVGLLSEEYFLYFEELDWAIRAKKKGYELIYACKSIVYHKEGASIGASDFLSDQKSLTSDFYLVKNRIKITKKYFTWALLLVYFSILISIANRLKRRQWDRIPVILKIILTT
jgi:GT2 family glycosyltransferase